MNNPTRLGSDTASIRGHFVPLFAMLFFAFFFMSARLWYLQVIRGAHYEIASESNRAREHSMEPSRGMILDRYGEILVDSAPRFDLKIVPEHVRDVERTAALLMRLVGVEAQSLIDEIARVPRSRAFEEIEVARDLDRAEVARVVTRMSDLPGVQIEAKPIRHYLEGAMAAHLLGHMGRINDDDLTELEGYLPQDVIGKVGVERRLERRLKGSRGRQFVEVDAHGRVRESLGVEPPVPGLNVVLTLDRDLQRVAEMALGERAGAVVALDPRNGEILTWVSHPGFDPNLFSDGIPYKAWNALRDDPITPLMDRPSRGLYPPASTFKLVTALAGLEERQVDPQKKVFCGGATLFSGRAYRCWKRGGHGWVNLHEAIVHSCDVYFYEVGKAVGVDAIASRAKRFGLGQRTGIDLSESPGIVPSTQWKREFRGQIWFPGQTLSVAIGQGDLLVSPLQAAVMISALANGGTRWVPRYVLELRDASGQVVERPDPVVAGQLGADPAHLARLRAALEGVVHDRSGTGARARIEGVRVAGKSGTAQVARLARDRDAKDREIERKLRDHAWFVAYAPAEAPVIAVAVFVEHAGQGGGRVAAPIAREVMQAHLARSGLLPPAPLTKTARAVPSGGQG